MSSTRIILITLIFYWIGLFIGTHTFLIRILPHEASPNDKFLHLIAYAGLTFLYFFTFMPGRQLTDWQSYLWLMPLAIYGVLDEITQPFVGRSCELLDWVADLAGISLGFSFALLAQYFICANPTRQN